MYKYLIILSLFLTACFTEDELITLPDYQPGETEVLHLENSMYSHVSYIDILENTVRSSEYKTQWDLCLSCTDTATSIYLNAAKRMYAAETGTTDFNAITELTGNEDWKWDFPNGQPDSTALRAASEYTDGLFFTSGKVYIIDRGIDELGTPQGYQKLVVENVSETEYSVRFANLNGNNETTKTITKEGAAFQKQFSFDGGGTINKFEPAKDAWHLKFTQYTTWLFTDEGEAVPYFVQGVLLNSEAGLQIAVDSISGFENLDITHFNNYEYTNQRDFIGHEWKTVTVDMETMQASYKVNPEITYLIKIDPTTSYKFHFLSYVNELNQKGFPVFEFQRL